MLFTAKQLHSYLSRSPNRRRATLHLLRENSDRLPTLQECKTILSMAKRILVSRQAEMINDAYLTKWLRPWEVVPELKDFQAPEGDYSVGIEVEYGFRSSTGAAVIAQAIKNWRYITMDSEGGPYGIEVTFAPMLYSKFGPTSQACRYLKLLDKNSSLLVQHAANAIVGTHVNLSYAGYNTRSANFQARMFKVNAYCDTRCGYEWRPYLAFGETSLTIEEQRKYFGREPYGGLNIQDTHIEFKLFNSVTDWKKLRKYVNVSVALLELIRSDTVINRASVVAALEAGYNKA